MSILRLKMQTPIADHPYSRDKALDREDGSQLRLEGKLDALVNLVTQLTANQMPASDPRVYGIRSSNDHHASICPSSQQSGLDEHPEAGVHDVATDTSAETRKLEGKLDALVNLVARLAANQKPAFVSRVCGIRSSNDHHTSHFSASNDAIVTRGVHDVATDTSVETRNLEGKLDALVNLVTQIATNQKPASVAKVCGIRPSNDNHASFNERKDSIIIRGVHDVPTETSAETRNMEGKLDGLVNLVTQLASYQKPASIARICGIRSSNDHHTNVCPSSQLSGVDWHPDAYAANTYNTSAETRKLKGKQIGLVNLVTSLAANQKLASVARVCSIRSSNGHHTRFNARNVTNVIIEVHDVATDTSVETRKLEDKLDALGNLVTQLAANQKPASVARVCGIRSSNDHHISVSPSSQQSGVDEHPEAYPPNTYSRPPQQRRQGT
ncbi:hypothetical protein Fmac_028519 [Flemingia macrophylla]|uniref:Uncharacterized protein n=1 Tax=Flemingia macrophylla TaxID=520843 RepID=A0ABD1L957_9FABA